MHRGRVLLLIAFGLATVSLPFPYLVADTIGNVTGSSTSGLLAVAALAGSAVVAVAGDRRDNLGALAALAAGAAVTLAVVVTAATLIDGIQAVRSAQDAAFGAALGGGLWVLTTAAVLALAGVVVGLSRRID